MLPSKILLIITQQHQNPSDPNAKMAHRKKHKASPC